jgi:nucleoside-diphosphate-sugar epimerase
MRIFITGGTGFIGSRLTERLVAEKHDLILLLRDPAKAAAFNNEKVTFVQGDLFDTEALRKGMRGCEWVFHMAAFTKPWANDESLPFKTNVTGTINVIEAAIENNVKKIIITSTGGTLGYSKDGNTVDESNNPDPEYHTQYEKTKAEAEKIALKYCASGIHIVIVNPTRVYGPGKLSKSNSLTKIIKLYISGFWRIMPGDGNSKGNYVFINDVVNGLILAAVSGRKGERYILGGENLTFREMFDKIGIASGSKRKIFSLSAGFLRIVIKFSALLTRVFGIPPIITREWLDKYLNDSIISSDKAVKELGYKITPFAEGVSETIRWLKLKQP